MASQKRRRASYGSPAPSVYGASSTKRNGFGRPALVPVPPFHFSFQSVIIAGNWQA